jgi:hypothetical protein
MRLVILGVLATLTMWLGQGCARVDNDRVTVGGEPLPAIDPSSSPMTPAQGPSLVGGSREGWAGDTIVVGNDGVRHQPTYTRDVPAYTKTHRSLGRYPTPETALDLGAPAGMQAAEGLAGPFYAGGDVVLFLPRAFMAAPWSHVSSPTGPMERGPAAD